MKNKTGGAKKYVVIAIFLLVCVLSAIFMSKVEINYNISDYLDKNTETKISLKIIEEEFGLTGDIQVVAEGVDVDTAKAIRDKIEDIEHVLSVSFDEHNENYYKDQNALFSVIVDGDEYSKEASAVLSSIKSEIAELSEKTDFGGTVVENNNLRGSIEGQIPIILAISLCLVVIIMLFTSQSWIEPFVLLLSSGVAVLINMGTNAILGEISYITNAVSAILQLALSVDYSIVLLHSYRALKSGEDDKGRAMTRAIAEVVRPVSASALTTVAGLLALLFMSFKIGFDIGIVLMKGIVISAITSLTLLPALLLLFDRIMSKTEKKHLAFSGKSFCRLSLKASRVIVPIALAVIISCGALQLGKTYSFTDTENADSAIAKIFGKNNTVVVVYPNGSDDYEKEMLFANKLSSYKTLDGKPVLKNHTAYSNTVRELYDVELAARKLDLSGDDAEMLLTMYHLYRDSSLVKLDPMEFIKYADELITNDKDAASLADEETAKTLRTLLVIDKLMNGENTAEEFHTLLTTGVMEGTELDLFSVKQMYGLYYYDSIKEKSVDFETMLDFMISASQKDELSGMLDAETAAQLALLSEGIKQFNAQMEKPLTQSEFMAYMYQQHGVQLDKATVSMIYNMYYFTSGEPTKDTIPFLEIMSFLERYNQITDPAAKAEVEKYVALYKSVNSSYTYGQFLTAVAQIATGLTGEEQKAEANELAVQQIYIMYFYEQNAVPAEAINGKAFIDFVSLVAESNPIVNSQLSDDGKAKLADIITAYGFVSDKEKYDFNGMTAKLDELRKNMQSISSGASIVSDKLSGIYVKFAIATGLDICEAVEARDLLDFVASKMDTHELLKAKMSDGHRAKVEAAKGDIARATDLFVGENYSRMLISVDLSNEGEESARFVRYLSNEVKEVFGEDAHVAGEMMSTYDLQQTFDKDNTLISIFTIISIFIIIMVIFRSLSLPIILVAVIQGAIWIAMSSTLITGPIFFMSYIVATCILMGATIDYGILMSTNYVQSRGVLDKKEALYKAVKASMPTVFTSGMILTICGFVVGFISGQNSISTVGVLLGTGTLVSVVMITLVLPSVLYLLDGFILKLTVKKKK